MVSNTLSWIVECLELIVVLGLVFCVIELIVLSVQDLIDSHRYKKYALKTEKMK
jgi:hypothetical protein